MKHLGVDFVVVRAIQSGKWRWSVSMIGVGTKAGFESCKRVAESEAKKAIVWLHSKKRRDGKLILPAAEQI